MLNSKDIDNLILAEALIEGGTLEKDCLLYVKDFLNKHSVYQNSVSAEILERIANKIFEAIRN